MFPENWIKANRPLQIIHNDVCGPIDPCMWDNKRNTLTLMDNYTHYTIVQLLTNKNEAFGFIKDFVCEVEAFHNLKDSKVWCDNGGEWNEMKNWGVKRKR